MVTNEDFRINARQARVNSRKVVDAPTSPDSIDADGLSGLSASCFVLPGATRRLAKDREGADDGEGRAVPGRVAQLHRRSDGRDRPAVDRLQRAQPPPLLH